MPPPLRYRTSIVLACGFLALYMLFGENVFPLEYGEHGVDVMVGSADAMEEKSQDNINVVQSTEVKAVYTVPLRYNGWRPSSTISSDVMSKTDVASLQEQFEKEAAALGLKNNAGAIFGNTLKQLVDSGGNAGFAGAALIPSNVTKSYTKKLLSMYDPYPEYNTKAWKTTNVGMYHPCDGPFGGVPNVQVFSGHPAKLGEPLMGSYNPLGFDSNLCFERETRLGVYIFSGDSSAINWGGLQRKCAELNADRFMQDNSSSRAATREVVPNPSQIANETGKIRRLDTIEDEAEGRKGDRHGMPTSSAKAKARTAFLIRGQAGRKFSNNDMQYIRSLITELCLKTGGEYQVWLLMYVDGPQPDITTNFIVDFNIPAEFLNLTIFWNKAGLKERYSFLPSSVYVNGQFSWLPVQMFSDEHPEFEFIWNWELDARYTGHNYDLLQKLSTFAFMQPRRGLWERSERFYIPEIHGQYSSRFRKTLAELGEFVWGPLHVHGVLPIGPPRPFLSPEEDKKYTWGVEEEADFISLTPIFNPANTTWWAKDEIWGFLGTHTPRRASMGLNSRISKKLLRAMDAEDLIGHHIGNEMAPATLALLHGLKAVHAPMPVFFDRAWTSESLEKYFNPGPQGQSGSFKDSPFSKELESRFEGSTWFSKSTPPSKLYNNWLGKEDHGIGGAQWEKEHGRMCLPPMLLWPVASEVASATDHTLGPASPQPVYSE